MDKPKYSQAIYEEIVNIAMLYGVDAVGRRIVKNEIDGTTSELNLAEALAIRFGEIFQNTMKALADKKPEKDVDTQQNVS